MAKIIVVTSGKGGVGKTTSTAAIGAGLAMRGMRTCVIDFDVGLRNLDVIMGCERRVVFECRAYAAPPTVHGFLFNQRQALFSLCGLRNGSPAQMHHEHLQVAGRIVC